MNKTPLLIASAAIAMTACNLDPLMTGNPYFFTGHKTEYLTQAWGQPKSKTPRGEDKEVWEYRQEGDSVSPKMSDTGFSFSAGQQPFQGVQGGGGIHTEETPAHMSHYVKIVRFTINLKKDKIVNYYGEYDVDGKCVRRFR